MARRRHSSGQILATAVATALDEGLGSLTYGAVARRLGISDRMVVYYYPTKNRLVEAVLGEIGAQLREAVAASVSASPVTFETLLQCSWPVLATPAGDRVFRLFFQLVGLAGNGSEPYRSAARGLIEDWVDWLAPLMVAREGCTPRQAALAALARIDGLLLLRQAAGARAANLAAQAMMRPASD